MSVVKPYHLKLFLSNHYATAQIVQKSTGFIVVAASSQEKALRDALKSKVDKEACGKVGELLAQRAKAAQIEGVHWARKPGQKYHGRIASLLDSMNGAGLPLV